ncbi:hypothetical protein [Nesterenkonia haasae]|uniref:hypothetical protein n=1 Tax=Nesterenkonia haasae TaxID=2587813 RepID=UPI00129279B8|nr:hypothetical protein [Nesterenkonia haasae]NDK31862.1 hypothetical protein [Nesterenkonia haasae]
MASVLAVRYGRHTWRNQGLARDVGPDVTSQSLDRPAMLIGDEMTVLGNDAFVAESVGFVLVGLMWALSLAALAGLAHLLGKWMRNREERRKRPLAPQDDSPAMSRETQRSVRKGKRRQDNASDLDGYL